MTVLPRGIRNNNPGNIRFGGGSIWLGSIKGTDPSFCTFVTMAFGVRACALLLLHYFNYEKINTIAGMFNRYAPPVENNTDAYIEAISQACGIPPHETIKALTPSLITAILRGITTHENGKGDFVSDEAYSLGVGNAFGTVPLQNLYG